MPGNYGGGLVGASHRRIERVRREQYATSFPLTENPISEGGKWQQNDVLQTKVKTVSGNAYGTQDGTGNFDDSSACLSSFGDDYEIEAIVALAGGLSAANREVELLLRWTDNGPLRSTGFGDTHSNGYECSFAWNGQYSHVGRFKGADLVAEVDSFATPANGDVVRARIQGFRIQVWWNAAQLYDVTDTDVALRQATGNPGIGFYIGVGGATTDFGFSSVIVRKV